MWGWQVDRGWMLKDQLQGGDLMLQALGSHWQGNNITKFVL